MKKPIKQNGRKRINNAGYKQYSHSYANDNYSFTTILFDWFFHNLTF
jgi:hypothetical protein